MARAFERALRRAHVPMAFSQGFSPHPKVSWVGAAPTGAASEAEYVEIGLAEVVDPAAVRQALGEALPDGLDVLEVVESAGGSLADRLEASSWLIDLKAPYDDAARAVATFLATDEVLVERMTKKGLRSFDCRGPVVSLEAEPTASGSRLRLLLRHGVPAVRPDDVISGLTSVGGLLVGPEHGGLPLLTRLAQGPFDEATGAVGDPLR